MVSPPGIDRSKNLAAVLVTGASGLLGTALVERLSRTYNIVSVSKSGRNNTIACDLTIKENVQKIFNHNFCAVIHTAAFSDVDGCEKNPGYAYASNALSTKFLSQECRSRKIPFIYVSTDYVFDGQKKITFETDDRPDPVDIYGMTKWVGEIFASQYAYLTCVIRTSWLFGAGPENNFVNVIARRLRSEKIVGVLSDQTNSPTYAKDLSEAIEKITEHLVKMRQGDIKAPYFKTFQFCNRGETTRFEMARAIKEILGLKEVEVRETVSSNVAGRVAIRPAHSTMSTKDYEDFFKVKIRDWRVALADYLLEKAQP